MIHKLALVFAFLLCLAFLAVSFAWATDPRPVEGTAKCSVRYANPARTVGLIWSIERDCKPRWPL